AGEPGHVGGIADDQEIDAFLLHGLPRLFQARFIFPQGEFEIRLGHVSPSFSGACRSQLSNAVPAPAEAARAKASVAMAVSWIPVPVRSAMVIWSAAVRPGFCPAMICPSSGKSTSASARP